MSSSLLTQLQAISASAKSSRNRRLENWPRVVKRAHEAHTQGAIEAYRRVMQGAGWLSSWDIECRLGYTRTSSAVFIRKLHRVLGLLERRNKGGGAYNRRWGYEYKWVEHDEP